MLVLTLLNFRFTMLRKLFKENYKGCEIISSLWNEAKVENCKRKLDTYAKEWFREMFDYFNEENLK